MSFHRRQANSESITQLDEVLRTARESACQRARYFVREESDHPGIVHSQLSDSDKRRLLSQMTFSAQYGCRLLHQVTADGKVSKWFGNQDFAYVLQKSLYDVTCPGWCGALDDLKVPGSEKVTVCQLIEVSAWTAASQMAWVSSFLAVIRLIVDPIIASTCRTFLP